MISVRTLVLLALLASPAHAGSKLALFGAGGTSVEGKPGRVGRAEFRADFNKTEGDAYMIFGSRAGFELWSAGEHKGLAVPFTWYGGAQVGDFRSTLGAGFGLWTFEFSKSPVAGGISPFVNASVEATFGDYAISLDGRVTRMVVGEMDDFNVMSATVMVGWFWR